jgi:hypothetical protein
MSDGEKSHHAFVEYTPIRQLRELFPVLDHRSLSHPATFDLRYPAHNHHDDCHSLPSLCLCLRSTRLPKVRAVCFWPPSFNKDVLYATPWLRCRLRSQIYPSRLMASVTFDTRHFVSLAHRQRRCRVPPPWYCILIIPTKGAMILIT